MEVWKEVYRSPDQEKALISNTIDDWDCTEDKRELSLEEKEGDHLSANYVTLMRERKWNCVQTV